MKKKIDKNVVSYRNDFHFFSVSSEETKKKKKVVSETGITTINQCDQ